MSRHRGDIVVSGANARFLGRTFCCSLGRNGITTEKWEGDGATPAGIFELLGILYRPDRIDASGMSRALPISRPDIWSDDPRDPAYNQPGRAMFGYRYSHERMRRSDRQYDLVIPTDYNWPIAVPGLGSAIFLHIWKRPRHPTAGCVAFAREDLVWIAERLTDRTRLVVRAG